MDNEQNFTLNPISARFSSNIECINSDDSFYKESEVIEKKFSRAHNRIRIESIEMGNDNVQYFEVKQIEDAEGLDLQRAEHVNCVSQIDDCQIELIDVDDDWDNPNVQYSDVNQTVVMDLQRAEHVNCVGQIDDSQIELIDVDDDWDNPNVQYFDVHQTEDDDSSVQELNRQITEDVNCVSQMDDCQIELIEVDDDCADQNVQYFEDKQAVVAASSTELMDDVQYAEDLNCVDGTDDDLNDDWGDRNVQYSNMCQTSNAGSSSELMNFEMPGADKVDCVNQSDDCQVDLIEVNDDWEDVYVQCSEYDNANSQTRSNVCFECSDNEITSNFDMPVDNQIGTENVSDNLRFDDQLERKGNLYTNSSLNIRVIDF